MRPWQQRGAKGRKREPGLNGLEKDFLANVLTPWLHSGAILWHSEHEAIKLRLADNTYYSPDWFVMTPTGDLKAYEVKGGLFPEKNRIKTKVAAELFPFPITICRRPRKREPWQYEEI